VWGKIQEQHQFKKILATARTRTKTKNNNKSQKETPYSVGERGDNV
jgi:hypothetical protein